MKNAVTSLGIFVFLICSSQAYAHECVHDDIEFEPVELDLLGDLDDIEALDLNTNPPFQPFRIHADYTGIAHLDAKQREFITEWLMPNAFNQIEKILSVAAEQRQIALHATHCYDAYIPEALFGVPVDANLIIFVISKPEKSNSTLASAIACFLNSQTGRPVAGRINLNPYAIKIHREAWKSQLNTVIHEIMHILGVSRFLFPYYRSPITGKASNESNVIRNVTLRGMPTHIITTPKVVEAARKYFDCPTIEGVELENEGAPGSQGSHWERRILGDELMTSTDGTDPKLTFFTLALLEDSGWYQANYSNARHLYFGRGRGCDFIYKPCIDNRTKTSRFPEFCSSNLTKECSFDGFTLARCVLLHRSEVPEAFNYFGNNFTGFDTYADGCPTPYDYYDADCRNPKASAPGVKGADSRCFQFFAQDKNLNIACMKHQCQYLANGSVSLQIIVDGTSIQCPTLGGKVSGMVPGAFFRSYNITFVCPPAQNICTGDLETNIKSGFLEPL